MNIKSTFLALLVSILPLSVSATTQYQHKLASVVLSDENASYIVKTINQKVHIVTFGYKNAVDSCKFLQTKGIDVVTVRNYSEVKDDDGLMVISYKKC